MDEDDNEIALSSDTLAALQNFYNQRDKDADAFEQLKSTTLQESNQQILSISSFKEDWNASQFWFTDATAKVLAEQLLQGATTETSIAIISAPSVFVQLKNLLTTGSYPAPARICLLEYDERFDLLGNFVRFDFNKPTDLPSDLRHAFTRVLCDPPYHSKECIEKYAETVEWLWKSSSDSADRDSRRVICTGQTMEDTVLEAFVGVKQVSFEPEHTAKLDNKYACFADFEF